MNLFLYAFLKNKHLKIYKDITYSIFLKNVFHLVDKLKNLETNEIYIYLPSCYHLIEIIFACIFANKNINYIDHTNLDNIKNKQSILITCQEYNHYIQSFCSYEIKTILINLNQIVYKEYKNIEQKVNILKKSKLPNVDHIFWLHSQKLTFQNYTLIENANNIELNIPKQTRYLFMSIKDNLFNTICGIKYLFHTILYGFEYTFNIEQYKYNNRYSILLTSNKNLINNNYNNIIFINHKNENLKYNLHIDTKNELIRKHKHNIGKNINFKTQILSLPYLLLNDYDFYNYLNYLDKQLDFQKNSIMLQLQKVNNQLTIHFNKDIHILYYNTNHNTTIYFIYNHKINIDLKDCFKHIYFNNQYHKLNNTVFKSDSISSYIEPVKGLFPLKYYHFIGLVVLFIINLNLNFIKFGNYLINQSITNNKYIYDDFLLYNPLSMNNILQSCIKYKLTLNDYLVYEYINKNIDFINEHNIIVVHNNKIVNDNIIEILSYTSNNNYLQIISKFKNSQLYELYKKISSNINLLMLLNSKYKNLFSIVTISFDDEVISNQVSNNYIGNIHFYKNNHNYYCNLLCNEKYIESFKKSVFKIKKLDYQLK